MSLIGGLAAAGLGGAGLAQAAARKPEAAVAADAVSPAVAAALDQADADFNQVVVRERVIRRGRGRPVVVRRRVIVRRPPPWRRRRRVITRRVIVR